MALLYSNASNGEVLTLGGADPAHYTGNFSCVPINTTNGLWLVKMEGVSIGNETKSPFCHNGCEASVDTGCSYIMIGPSGEVELLHKKLGGTYAPNITNLVSAERTTLLSHTQICCFRCTSSSTSSLAPRENLFLRLSSKLVAKITLYQEWSMCKK